MDKQSQFSKKEMITMIFASKLRFPTLAPLTLALTILSGSNNSAIAQALTTIRPLPIAKSTTDLGTIIYTTNCQQLWEDWGIRPIGCAAGGEAHQPPTLDPAVLTEPTIDINSIFLNKPKTDLQEIWPIDIQLIEIPR
jgi:hypothetical protein